MSNHHNTTLTEYITDEQSASTTPEPDSPDDPSSPSPEEDTVASPCPCYEAERSSPEWQAVADRLPGEPKCGHALRYLKEEAGAKGEFSTFRDYCSSLRMYIDYLHEHGVTVCEASLRDVDRYCKHLARTDRSEGTIKSHLTAITNLYKHIERLSEEHGSASPSVNWAFIREDLNPGDYNTCDPIEREPLEKEEVIALYDAVGSLRDKLMIQAGVELGPRRTDLTSIKIGDVDLDNSEVTLSNTKAGGTYTVPITEDFKLLLRRWIRLHRKQISGATDHEFLFPNQTRDGDISDGRFENIVRTAAERAGIQEVIGTAPIPESQKQALNTDKEVREFHRVTPHTLRHTFAHLLTEAGIPIEEVSAALDHSNTDVTEEFYDHSISNYHELMDRLFSGVSF